MLLPQWYKDELRKYLMEMFGVKESVLLNTMSINTDIKYNEALNMISCPIVYADDFLNMVRGEGLFVSSPFPYMFRISASQ